MKLLSLGIILIFFLVFTQFALSNIRLLKKAPAQDFEVFYLAGSQVWKNQNPYLKLGKDIVRNPPPTILLFSLLNFLPIMLSQVVWFVLSFLSFLLAIFLLFKILNINGWKIWLSCLSLIFIFFPFRYNLGSGQVNNFLFLLIVLTFYYTETDKLARAAISLALAIVLKVTPVFLLLIILFQKKFNQLILILVFLAALLIITGGLLNFDIYKYYSLVGNSYLDFANESYYNQSLAAFINRLIHNPSTTRIIILCSIFLFVSPLIFLIVKIKNNFAKEIIIWNISILYMLILAPFAWQYHFVIAIFPLITTAYLIKKRRSYFIYIHFIYILLFISYLMLGWNIKNPSNLLRLNILGSIILSHVAIGTILLLIINYYLLKKITEAR